MDSWSACVAVDNNDNNIDDDDSDDDDEDNGINDDDTEVDDEDNDDDDDDSSISVKFTVFGSYDDSVTDNVVLSRLSLSMLVSKTDGDASKREKDVDTDREGVTVMGPWSSPTTSKLMVDVMQPRRASTDL